MSLNQEYRMIRHRENILSDDKFCKICYQIMYTGLQLRNCIHAFNSICLVLYSEKLFLITLYKIRLILSFLIITLLLVLK